MGRGLHGLLFPVLTQESLSSDLASVVQRQLFHSGRQGVLCGRRSSHLFQSVSEPQSSCISLGRQGTCSGSKLCCFPGAL